jgi:hypothetical protein
VRSEEGGGKCGAVSGRGGVVGAVAAHVEGGGGGAWSGFWRKKKVGPANRAVAPVSEGVAAGQAGPEGKGGKWATTGSERKGRRWAVAGLKSLLGLKSKKVKENQF